MSFNAAILMTNARMQLLLKQNKSERNFVLQRNSNF